MIVAQYRPGGWHDLTHQETGVRLLTVRPVGTIEWGQLTGAFTARWIPDLLEAFALAQRIAARERSWEPYSASDSRWWRLEVPLGPAAESAAAAVGNRFHRHAAGPHTATWDYLGPCPPDTGHTWVPLTAPGVTEHPNADVGIGHVIKPFVEFLIATQPWMSAQPTYGRPDLRRQSVADAMRDVLREADLTVECRRWMPHYENRRLPLRLSDV
ncbi:hypothetical protein [Mycolicibacterium canariasense]|uniref:hypothetical protein n=1 Tax=Mycolicibacterium canariasense TaxID=228230 RepID=UPI000A16BB88|nr:hypothetical protein [Mycolicibacterium canariasense]MCV7208391.1 hypothetical protein [Mycolicibacterium canariasense]ORV13573.1 hypothetical protein AWB94_04965 [Mycolicibacterium canariasense]